MAPRGGCQAELSKTSENTTFSHKTKQKTQKMLIIRQIDWREVGWPLSCNAFALARFVVVTDKWKILPMSAEGRELPLLLKGLKRMEVRANQ